MARFLLYSLALACVGTASGISFNSPNFLRSKAASTRTQIPSNTQQLMGYFSWPISKQDPLAAASLSVKVAPPVEEAPRASLVEEAPRAPNSFFVSVFSARVNVARRNTTRNLWAKRHKKINNVSVMYFAVCKWPPADGENDWVAESLRAEKKEYKDIILLDCQEGRNSGQMAAKLVKSMEFYRRGGKGNNHTKQFPQTMYVHTEDDMLVSWNRMMTTLNTIREIPSLYMGEEISEGKTVNRDKNSIYYQPEDVYPYETYPRHMSRHCIVMGRQLVLDILDSNVTNRMPLANMEQAVGVWVDTLANSGHAVNYLRFDPPTKDKQGNQVPYSACGDVWAHYPFLWQHGLQDKDKECLNGFDASDNSEYERIDNCLSECNPVR